MTRFGIVLMTTAIVALAGAEAIAQGQPLGPPPERIAVALGLTDQQKAVWDAAFQTMRATAEPLREQARAIQGEIDDLFSQGSPDPTLLGQKMIALRAVHDQLRQAREAMESSTAAVLTADQKLKLDALKAAMPHRGRPGGPPPAR